MITIQQANRVLTFIDRVLGAHTGAFPEVQYHCPFCVDKVGSESKQRKLRVNVMRGKATCFRCHYAAASMSSLLNGLAKGRQSEVASLLAMLPVRTNGMDIIPVSVAALGILYPPLMAPPITALDLKPVKLPAEYVLLAGNRESLCRRGLTYAAKRGITEDDLQRHQIGYCVSGRYAQRLIFPVHMFDKQVYFANRYCDCDRHPHLMKSMNPPNLDGHHTATTCFLGFDAVVGKPRVSLVEGPIDWLSTPDSLPTLGKELSENQIELLRYLASHGMEELVVVRDADASAHATLSKLYGRLPTHVRLSGVLLDAGDPGSRRAEMPALLESRRHVSVADRVRQCFMRSK